MTETPLVSVVIPAYNAAWCVARAIESVFAQGFRDFELIVVDDGSTDSTAAVLSGFGNRLRVLSKANGGLSSARNAGILASRGRYVAFLDADDWWLADKLERQVALMRSRPELAFCSTAARIEGPGGESLGEWRCGGDTGTALEAIFAANAFVAGSGSAVLARRDALDQAGGFDERLRSLEDIDMWMRLAAVGGYACVADPLTVILKRPDSMSGNLDVMRNAAITVMRKNRHLLPPGKRGAFWRHAYAGMLSDYAKWAWRAQRRGRAIGDALAGLCIAPLSRGRLMASLLVAMLRNRPI
ncbi:glycosyltransferase family 2 protein [Aromatoleum diolicum]|uniref:Glycosyltransferase n=1 Tax=Aromatoleum diolicum TaxID=75796 RepID=A0ABX1QDE4_9RHOO|nr:glycosyltransferase family A protein [Aromatoleum diolicum]NMG76005.1 glycosyltransferase [Aromatoleum diolicum]